MHALRDLSTGELHSCPRKGVLVLGSAETVTIRIQSTGVVAEHVRVTCQQSESGPRSLKLHALEAGVKLNGEPIEEAVMRIGDELEIADCRFRFEEIKLEASAPASRSSEAAKKSSKSSTILVAAIGSGVILVVLLMFWTRSQDVLPSNWVEVRQHYELTRFVDADKLLDEFQRDWAAGDMEREAVIAKERQRMQLFAARLETGRLKMIADAASLTPAAQIRSLKERRDTADSVDRRVAELLLSNLADLRIEGIQRHDLKAGAKWLASLAAKAKVEAARASELAVVADTGEMKEEQSDAVLEPEAKPARNAKFHSLVEEALAGKHYAQAVEILTQILLTAEPEEAVLVAEDIEKVVDRARAHLKEVVDEARTAAMTNTRGSLVKARSMIADVLLEVPTFSGLRETRNAAARRVADFERRTAALPDPRQAPIPKLQRKQEQGREFERSGRFTEASQLYLESSSLAAEQQPFLSSYLAGKSLDCSLLAELSALIADQLAANPARVLDLENGRQVEIRSLLSGRLVSTGGDEFPLGDLSATGLDQLLDGFELSPYLTLAAGLLGYVRNDRSQAEAKIAQALKADPSLAEFVGGLISRGRDELIGNWDYQLVGGEFIGASANVDPQMLEDITKKVGDRRARNAKAWKKILEEILSAGPMAIEPLIVALRSQVEEELERTQGNSFAKFYRQIREQRLTLDKARDAALLLIFSEEQYFYPCQLPAVSEARQREFELVQEQVEERVEAVRLLWNGKNKTNRPNSRLQLRVEKIEWMISQLEFLGELTLDLRRQIAWWELLPREGELSLKNFLLSAEEAVVREGFAKIRSKNLEFMAEIAAVEAEQMRATNDYREMFGLAPMTFDLRLYQACKAHAEQMEAGGFFSHFSPDPDRRSIFERAALANYAGAASENIIQCSSAAEALILWTQSSAQHRNLLAPANRDFAVGNRGMHWVQGFGRGIGR